MTPASTPDSTPAPAPTRQRILSARLIQPDQRTCGPSCLVVARMLTHEEYAEQVLAAGSFAHEVLALHRRANRLTDRITGRRLTGRRLQLAWPRALGLAPWAAARLMSRSCGGDGRRYRTHPVTGRREVAYVAVSHAVRTGHVVPIYLGSRWLPRHVVLAVSHDAQGLHVYDPAVGTVVPMPATGFVAGTLAISGWTRPWFVITPRR